MNTSENQWGDSAPHFKCLLDCFIHIFFAHIWCVVHNSTVMRVQVIMLSVCREILQRCINSSLTCNPIALKVPLGLSLGNVITVQHVFFIIIIVYKVSIFLKMALSQEVVSWAWGKSSPQVFVTTKLSVLGNFEDKGVCTGCNLYYCLAPRIFFRSDTWRAKHCGWLRKCEKPSLSLRNMHG